METAQPAVIESDRSEDSHSSKEGAGQLDKVMMAETVETLEEDILSIDEQIASLRNQRAVLVQERDSLANLVDEARFEISKWADWNGPILATIFGAGILSLFWTDIQTIAALYYYDSMMEADWLTESENLLLRWPSDFMTWYGKVASSKNLAILLTTKASTSAVSYFVGDLVAQAVEGRRRLELLDLPRTLRNAALGFFLHGPLLHYWILCMEGPIASLAGGNDQQAAVFLKIFLDQTFFSAFINLAYATIDGLLADKSVSEAWNRARAVLVPSVVASWRFWPFVHLLSYSPLIPVEYKLLWIDVMEIVWVAILSATVNAGDSDAKKEGATLPWGEGRFKPSVLKERATKFAEWMSNLQLEDLNRLVSEKMSRRKGSDMTGVQDARRDLQVVCKTMRYVLKNLSSQYPTEEKADVETAVQETLDWLDSKQAAKEEEIVAKREELQNLVKPILKGLVKQPEIA